MLKKKSVGNIEEAKTKNNSREYSKYMNYANCPSVTKGKKNIEMTMLKIIRAKSTTI